MRVITLGFALLILSCSSFAQLEVTIVGTDYAIDFDSQINGVTGPNAFDGTGFVPNPTAGQLDSDAWSIIGLNDGDMVYGNSYTNGDYARGDASSPVGDGGIYSAEVLPGDTALVIQPSGSDLTPGTIELRCLNQTGQFINSISLSYEIHVRNDQDRSTDFHAGIRTERMGDYTDISDGKILASQLEYTSDAANSGPNFVQVDRDHTFTGMIIDPGEFFYIVWETDDNSGSGSRDELALDDIVINVQGVDSLILYSQNSGEQTTSVLSSTQQWSSRPSGNVQFLMYPLEEEADYQIQSGDTMIIGSNSAAIEMKDLIVQSGAQVLGESDGIASTNQRYIDVFGDVICDGTIGLADGSLEGAGIGLDFKPGSHTISGNGDVYCSRIRKDNDTLNLGACELIIGMDATVHWANRGIINDRPNQDGGSNLFNITVTSGNIVNVSGDISIDGNDPTSMFNTHSAGGSIIVEGILNVGGSYYATTNNDTPTNPLPVSLTIMNGGVVNVNEIIADSSMADGHLLVVESGGLLNITGADTWSNFSVWNNNYDLQPNSSVAYSHTGDQTLPDSLVYSNLVLSGSGNKTLSPTASGKLKVTGNLSIQDAAVLQPNSLDINLSGSWSSYGESAFNESGVSVAFDNATGTSTISCGDTERFDDLVISGEVMLNSSIHVLNSLDLSSRVDLNSNEVIIEEPVNTNISSGAGYFVSEDVLHRGRITNVVNGYTGPVDFPFGTSSGTPIYCRTTLTSGTLDTISMATYPTDVNNLPLPSEPIAVTDIPSTSGLEPDNREATANRFWSIESDGTSFTVDLELALDSNEVPTTAPYNDIPTLVAQRYQSSTDEWQPPYPDQSAVLGGPSPRTVTISIDDVDAFSAWGVASSSSPLPVELLSYSGKAVNEGVQLNWTTASEVNNSHFELRRFSDVGNETWIGSVNGNGYSTSQLDYAFLDREPVSGWNYYRLIQHDFDGTIDDLGVINVLWDELQASEIVFTQWRDGLLSLRVNSDLVGSDLIIFNSSGRIISTAFIGSELMEIPFAQSEGIYLLRIEKDSKIITKKLGR